MRTNASPTGHIISPSLFDDPPFLGNTPLTQSYSPSHQTCGSVRPRSQTDAYPKCPLLRMTLLYFPAQASSARRLRFGRRIAFLAHGVATHLDAVSIVHRPVEDAVSDGAIADLLVLAHHRQLGGVDGGASAEARRFKKLSARSYPSHVMRSTQLFLELAIFLGAISL